MQFLLTYQYLTIFYAQQKPIASQPGPQEYFLRCLSCPFLQAQNIVGLKGGLLQELQTTTFDASVSWLMKIVKINRTIRPMNFILQFGQSSV
jgi:hypothetical protein